MGAVFGFGAALALGWASTRDTVRHAVPPDPAVVAPAPADGGRGEGAEAGSGPAAAAPQRRRHEEWRRVPGGVPTRPSRDAGQVRPPFRALTRSGPDPDAR